MDGEAMDSRIAQFESKIQQKLGAEEQTLVRHALDYAVHVHGDKKRASGEPAYYHDISVAEILLDLNMDLPSILAGLLHDTIEERTSGFHTQSRSATPKEQGDHPNP